MKSHMVLSTLLGLVLAGCQNMGALRDYYSGGTAPQISGIDDGTVPGNVGGQTRTISGSGFGTDPSLITVIVGQTNAPIESLTDSSITIQVPQGPIQGGPVDVIVGTQSGQDRLTEGLTYDLGTVYDNQSAYIVINNDWESCYGGIGSGINGCETFAWEGQTGISGRGEFMADYAFPRQHGQFVGYWGGADVALGEWQLEKPPYNSISLDIESEVQDQRNKSITGFTLRNENWGDTPWCAAVSTLATYTYGGGDPVDSNDPTQGYYPQQSVSYANLQLASQADTSNGVCSNPDDRMYNLGQLDFCETYYDHGANLKAYQHAGTYIYETDWPVGESFFVGQSQNPSANENITTVLDVAEAGVNGVPLVLPPNPHFEASAGFTGLNGDPTHWAVASMADCPDGNGDGSSTLDEAGLRFQWKPADLGAPEKMDPSILDQSTTVRMTVNSYHLGWYGGEGFDLRASITVPDSTNFDEQTGLSTLDMPSSILMQFPTLSAQLGSTSGPFGTTFTWGDPLGANYGYFLVTMERVTEYRLDAPKLPGDLVVSYVDGDFGLFSWNNPLDNTDSCGNCQDDDGDGWTDGADPDCADGKVEDNHAFGQTTCNDGIDNDNDGLIDAEDSDCADGLDGETNCSDGIDNDGDGLIDAQDGECGPSGSGVELGKDDPSWQCSDGIDNDGDGYIDFDDPDCTNGADDEVGFGSTACNDGIDNDGHGDPDATDLICAIRGATYDTEAPPRIGACDDGIDNDDDGYIDANDPDCEIQPYSGENWTQARSGWGGWTSQCYNGIDDDSDGLIDGNDPGCAAGSGPDGFLDDESAG